MTSAVRLALAFASAAILYGCLLVFDMPMTPAHPTGRPLAQATRLAASSAPADTKRASDDDPHREVLAKQYPSATECARCHKQIYDEWRSSNHAYAAISPMFHKFEQTISNLSQGTVGYFCMRCHASVGTSLKEPRELPLWKRNKVSLEGVTCISCHRVNEAYGKVDGERRIAPGEIYDPVYGNIGGDGVDKVASEPGRWRVKTSADKPGPGMKMHAKGIRFAQISESQFCVSCHQVAVHPGIKLEIVWDQYRASPAAAQGIRCQECHMGKTPGQANGYTTGPAAVVNGRAVNDKRVHHNHAFFGPGYPISHPGIFPHNPDNDFPIDQWLQFDYRAGWGTPEFERQVSSGTMHVDFPEAWRDAADREKARRIVTDNEAALEQKRQWRIQVMENGSKVDGPFFDSAPQTGRPLSFHYVVRNTNSGHNLPSGSLGAQPELWLNVALINPEGKRVWESGYVDSNGDMADQHSLDVAEGKIPVDTQLFNLQTKFLTSNVKGTDREVYLPVNMDIDQIPFLRPAGQPVSVMNHPPFIRMESRSLPPLGSREARYNVPARLLSQPGRYRLAVRLRSRAEPIYFMRFVGATREMERRMNEWMIDLDKRTVQFEVSKP